MSLPKKTRQCRVCKVEFTPVRCLQNVCSPACAQKAAEISRVKKERQRQKDERRMIKESLEKLKPASYWKARAKRWFHAWVRARDEGKECISCDTILVKLGRIGGDYDAGHRRSVGSAKHLEFDERNVHGQCKYCNDRLSGNPDGYNAKLPSRIGQEEYCALMADEEPRNLRAEDYKLIEATYKAKLKELKA